MTVDMLGPGQSSRSYRSSRNAATATCARFPLPAPLITVPRYLSTQICVCAQGLTRIRQSITKSPDAGRRVPATLGASTWKLPATVMHCRTRMVKRETARLKSLGFGSIGDRKLARRLRDVQCGVGIPAITPMVRWLTEAGV